ncbi:MAG: formylglycine-generating enzyme family protein [Planctomycetes bacterium]|nr:formylglycine-generating enzyme family protein [Planctomycetota bacterium]MBM4084162.1 formylglycine-generating enzyme family protein [Planctomycetota bacterium]
MSDPLDALIKPREKSAPPAPAPEGMVYVPAGEFIMGADEGSEQERPKHKVVLPAYFIDICLVTNAQFKRFVAESGYKPQGHWSSYYVPGQENFAVRGVSWQDASAYAKWAGKRLPTEAEWEKAGRGARGQRYPWGNDPRQSRVKVGLSEMDGLGPVGTNPGDLSPVGCHDMVGSVLEWTSSLFAPYPYKAEDGREDANASGPRVVRGAGATRKLQDGHWIPGALWLRRAESTAYLPNKWTYRGFRCAMNVEWMPPSDMAFVPPGEFIMGSDSAHHDERPQRKVHLDGYYMDRHPVTNAQFQAFIQKTGYEPEGDPMQYFTPGQEHFPVRGVTWGDAFAYARWAKKRLPTEAEWEKAARGTDGRTYPWGNEWEPEKCNVRGPGGRFKKPSPVGEVEADRSPTGCSDMAGAIWEWCADWYSPSYYVEGPKRNPKGPDQGDFKVVRGGGWQGDFKDMARCSCRNRGTPARLRHTGFRCARSLSGATRA